ncbi:MAG TPA: YraN family protein [Patescibacteria group bacterium]
MLSQKQEQQHNFSFGSQGERQAVEFLKKEGYQILDVNVSFNTQEIDIIALDTELDEIVFVEVKSRWSDEYGHPSKAVTREKLRNIQYVAGVYRQQRKLDKDYRFDIITVITDTSEIEHFENVTWLG